MTTEDDPQPVSFQELKKRWAQQQEATRPPDQSSPPPPAAVKPASKSPPPAPQQQHPMVVSSYVDPPLQNSRPSVTTTTRPRIPPKPPVRAATTSHGEAPAAVSMLTHQFGHLTTRPSRQDVSSSTQQASSSQDPFCDNSEEEEEEAQDSSDSGISLTSSGNEQQQQQQQPSPQQPPQQPPPPPRQSSLHLFHARTPPPPPPPSKKYHSAARIPSSNHSNNNNNKSCTDSNVSISPPSLPPRPTLYSRSQPEPAPVLPPRPSTSTLARSHTIAAAGIGGYHHHHHHQHHMQAPPIPTSSSQPSEDDNRLRRSQSTRATSARKAIQMQQVNGVYPDFNNASRKKPFIRRERKIHTGHRGTIRAVAACGRYLATGAHETRLWNTDLNQHLYSIDSAAPNDNADKIYALAFAPTPLPKDEGAFLWVGLKEGELMIIDTSLGRIVTRPQSRHDQTITAIMRYRNTEIWTLDEGGTLCIWDAHSIGLRDQRTVTPRTTATLLTRERHLWMSSGRTIEVYRDGMEEHEIPRVRIPNDLGNITQFATVPYHVGKVVAAHDNGKASVWDANTLERLEVITVSMYGITSMVAVGEHHVWMGYNTGMIYVYDTRPVRWTVVKMWKAHDSAIVKLVVEDIGMAIGDETTQVVSVDSHGYMSLWDGLLPEYWKDQKMQMYQGDFCRERDTRVLICSWNIDANKPEKLTASDDKLVREWLRGMQDPDIIVVGIQEIVDLESKKQTARSLFASRKKIESLQEADELLTHRYTLWHDHLVQVIRDNYKHADYTVIKTDQLVGLFSCIFVKSSELRRVSNVESAVVKTGMKVMNKSLHGNKGGIAIRFQLDDASLCFVNCHLAAGQSHTQQRNADAEGILQSADFRARDDDNGVFSNGGDGSMILDHEHCFLSGDLNYRINMNRDKVIDCIQNMERDEALAYLQKEDQLLKQRIVNPLFKLLLFQESRIDFLPTYKYDPGTDYYDRSEKKRVPAWCDRILYRSKNAENLFYRRHEVLASDHRPISGGFRVRVKQIDRSKEREVAFRIEEAWYEHYLQLVQERKVTFLTDYGLFDAHEAKSRLQATDWDVGRAIEQALYSK